MLKTAEGAAAPKKYGNEDPTSAKPPETFADTREHEYKPTNYNNRCSHPGCKSKADLWNESVKMANTCMDILRLRDMVALHKIRTM